MGPREGEYVKRGQVLASIDSPDYQLPLAAAKAQADEQARIGFERAEDEYRRMKMLFDSKSLAPNDFQKYKAAYDPPDSSTSRRLAVGRRLDAGELQQSERIAESLVMLATRTATSRTGR